MKRLRRKPKVMMTLTFGVDFLQWLVVDDHHLEKSFDFDDFVKALEFVNIIGDICEEQDHHAEFILSWGRVVIKTWSHDVQGITKRDYELANAIDEVTINGP
jgi:4a-hydroxytetrahydrobiopterin dehydratase|tara:strand:- start:200 stop:505 length:306 start_codon:yes stop_codon:yes gene_type:complete